MLERRQGKRYLLSLPVQVRWKVRGTSVGRSQGRTGNISSSGLLVVIPNPLPLGTTISLTIHVPSGLTKLPVELSCLGRVVRKRRTGKGHGISAIIEDFQSRRQRQKVVKTQSPRTVAASI